MNSLMLSLFHFFKRKISKVYIGYIEDRNQQTDKQNPNIIQAIDF